MAKRLGAIPGRLDARWGESREMASSTKSEPGGALAPVDLSMADSFDGLRHLSPEVTVFSPQA